jgi:hypothetical protein
LAVDGTKLFAMMRTVFTLADGSRISASFFNILNKLPMSRAIVASLSASFVAVRAA